MIDDHDPHERLEAMSDRDFLAAWKRVFGQFPAAILNRGEMIALLLQDGPASILERQVALDHLRASMRAE
jgi:hypothetical protein